MKIDQCLFGYDDGHRLLATSLSLENETSFLTELSDLAPGTIFGSSDGYWTGLPVPSIGRYVLMRTWPAPEMPRPGCVWTHCIFIEPKQFELVSDLSIFIKLFIRPNASADWSSYKNSIEAELSDSPNQNLLGATDVIYELISSLYATSKSVVVIKELYEFDEALFSVWSQQWPRLRRNFRFQTAVSRSLSVRGNTKFDICPIIDAGGAEQAEGLKNNEKWIRAAIEDIQNKNSSGLKKFLWKYGSGVKRQRGSFRPLTEIFLLIESQNENSAQIIFNVVCNYFSSADEAIKLKQDLVDGYLYKDIQADFIYYIVLDDSLDKNSFPSPSEFGAENLRNIWLSRPEFIINILGAALFCNSPFCKEVATILLNIIQTKEFWQFANMDMSIARRVFMQNPKFLFENASIIKDEVILNLIPTINESESGLSEFIYELTLRNNRALVCTLIDKIPKITVENFIHRSNDNRYLMQGNAWVDVIIKRSDIFFDHNLIELVKKPSLVYLICRSQDWFSPRVCSRDANFWMDAFYGQIIDISPEEEDHYCCFLLLLACKTGGDSGYKVIEQVYDRVHRKVLKSQLRWDAREMLMQRLPNIGKFYSWDLGLRLRLAVTKAYLNWHWPATSYGQLANDKRGRALLAEALSSFDNAFEYLHALD